MSNPNSMPNPSEQDAPVTTPWDSLSELPNAEPSSIENHEENEEVGIDQNLSTPESPSTNNVTTNELTGAVETARAEHANDPDYPHVFWQNDNQLNITVGGQTQILTPDEAIQQFGSNPLFMNEYSNLMNHADTTTDTSETPATPAEDFDTPTDEVPSMPPIEEFTETITSDTIESPSNGSTPEREA